MFPYGTVSGSALYTKCRVLTCFHGEMESRQRSQCGLNISQSPHSICCILLHLSVPAAMQFLLKHLLIPRDFHNKNLACNRLVCHPKQWQFHSPFSVTHPCYVGLVAGSQSQCWHCVPCSDSGPSWSAGPCLSRGPSEKTAPKATSFPQQINLWNLRASWLLTYVV